MKLVKDKNWYIFECNFQEKHIPKKAGFWWNTRVHPRKWATNDVEKAYSLVAYADKNLKSEMQAEIDRSVEQIDQSHAVDSEINIPAPTGQAYLPFQRAGISYALQRENTLIADEMGLGKTIQALGVVNVTSPKSVLVICPASLRINWSHEAKKWLVNDYNIYVVDNNKPIPDSANFVIVNYERLSVEGINRSYDLLIVDECHKLKNGKAKRTKQVLGYWDKQTRSVMPGIADRCDRKLFLTGTPIVNKPIELWPVLNKCLPKDFKNIIGYAKRYCNGHYNGYGWDFNGASNLDELQRKLRSKLMVRRLKSDVLKELPAKRRQLHVLPANGNKKIVKQESLEWQKYQDKLDKLQAYADLAWASGDDVEYKKAVEKLNATAKNSFVEISKIRHSTALAKVQEFVDFAKEAVESVGKVVVFAHHIDVVDKIFDELKEYNPVKLTGDMSPEKRNESVNTFQDNSDCKVFIGTIGAAGVGITLTAANTVLFAELDWVPGNVTQAEDRVHRIGQDQSVNIYHVVLDESIDQRMAEILIEKQNIIDNALDNNCTIDLDNTIVIPTQNKRGEKPKKDTEYTDEIKRLALDALKVVSGSCDGAVQRDGVGFNGCDTAIGKSLAICDKLTDRQTWLAISILRKYRNTQLCGLYDILFE